MCIHCLGSLKWLFILGDDDEILPSQVQVHDQSSPERPRKRSQVQKMAHILLETQIEPYSYKIVLKPDILFPIT